MEGTKDTSTKSANFDFVIKTALNAMQLAGAELVDDEEFERRKNICEGCNQYVNLLFEGVEVKGCKICKCPLETKGRTSKYFSFVKLQVVPTTCPSELGNKWQSKTT